MRSASLLASVSPALLRSNQVSCIPQGEPGFDAKPDMCNACHLAWVLLIPGVFLVVFLPFSSFFYYPRLSLGTGCFRSSGFAAPVSIPSTL